MRWSVERTNWWLSNYGRLGRNIDRHTHRRLVQIDPAITMILTIEMIEWADR